MKIKAIFDSKCYSSKPEDAGRIVNSTPIETMQDYSIEEIKENILQGKTIRPSNCGPREESWLSQQMFMIDVDDNLTIEQAILRCSEMDITPNFIYTTFSHTEEHHKFRLAFVVDKEITDYPTAKRIHLFLMRCIGESDASCKNLSKIYFAGKTIPFDSGNVLDASKIIELSMDIKLDKKDMKRPSVSSYSEDTRKGVHDNKGKKELPLLSYTPKTPYSSSDNYTIKAIANRDVAYLKNRYGNGLKKVFETTQEFMDYIRKEINLGEFLGYSYAKSITCLFHEDNKPSASIFQNEDGVWFYKCHSKDCFVSYNIVGVIESLANFKRRPRTYKFIKEIFNLEISETEWQKEQKETLLENLKVLNNGELEKYSPQASKNIKRIKHYLEAMTLLAMDNVHNDNLTDADGHVLFFVSMEYLSKYMGVSSNSKGKTCQKIAGLTYHKLINKLDDKELPEKMLKRAKALCIKGNKDNKYNHIGFYSIPSYTVNKFPEIEQRGVQWKEHQYTMKGVSREMFFRAEGLEVANEIYPQYKKVTEKVDGENQVVDRTTTEESDRMTNDIVRVIQYLMSEYGYATEKGIVEQLRSRYTEFIVQTQIKKSLKEICDLYDLKRVRANKEIKKQFGITTKGYPFIIVQNE